MKVWDEGGTTWVTSGGGGNIEESCDCGINETCEGGANKEIYES